MPQGDAKRLRMRSTGHDAVGDYRFVESGLDNVMLRHVEVLKCERCGSITPVLSKINQLATGSFDYAAA